MKKSFIILTISFLFLSVFSLAQGKYSIDVKSKDRKVPVSYFVNQTKVQFKDAREWRKMKRIKDKGSKKTKRHVYNIQTREVKKRMKKSERKSDNYNRGKIPLGVKLKRLILNG